MVRAGFWVAFACTAAGFALSAYLVALSFRPEPGANMVLMGLPCVASPTSACAAVTLWVAGTSTALGRRERRVATVAGGMALMVFVALAVLG